MIKNLFSLLILFNLICHLSVGQKLVYSKNVDFKKFKDIEGIKDNSYFIIKGRTSSDLYSFCVINKDKNIFKSYECDRPMINLLGFSSDSMALNLYFASSDQRFECFTFSKVSDKIVDIKKLEFDKSKHFLSTLMIGSQFGILSLKIWDHMIHLDIYEKDKLVDTKEFPLNDEKLIKYLRDHPLTYIPDNIEMPFDKVLPQNKLYIKDNGLRLVIDDMDEKTPICLIMDFDFNKKDITVKKVPLIDGRHIVHNSFLKDGRLFVLSINNTILNLSVFDIEALNKIKDYNLLEDVVMEFKRSPLMKNDVSMDDKEKDRAKEKTPMFILNNLNYGTPVIGVYSAPGENLRLLIGSKKIVKIGGGPSVIQTADGHTRTTSMSSSSVENTYKMSFWGFLKEKDLSISSTNMPLSTGVLDHIKQRQIELEKEEKSIEFGIISMKDNTQLIYFDKRKGLLCLEEF